jgi:hypothetical protein
MRSARGRGEQSNTVYCGLAPRIGRIQRQCRRATIARPGRLYTTGELVRRCFPRLTEFDRWHWATVRRGADKFLTRIGRRGRELLWRARL